MKALSTLGRERDEETDLTLGNSLFYLLDLDFTEAFDLEEGLACRRVDRLVVSALCVWSITIRGEY